MNWLEVNLQHVHLRVYLLRILDPDQVVYSLEFSRQMKLSGYLRQDAFHVGYGYQGAI